jgi:hypothetical protein
MLRTPLKSQVMMSANWQIEKKINIGIKTRWDMIANKQYWFRWRRVLTKGRYGEWSLWYF